MRFLAQKYPLAKQLTPNNYLGYSDWRLPNINELKNLYNIGYPQEVCGQVACANNVDWLNAQGFSMVYGRGDGVIYWSSTTVAAIPYAAYHFGIYYGVVDTMSKTGGPAAWVWPVRSQQ